ncbi:MAG: tetratricopeptide repeat protein [Pseudomonadota bacterium]
MSLKSWYIALFVLLILIVGVILHPSKMREGWMLYKSAKVHEAIEKFKTILTEEPDNYRAINMLAKSLENIGETEEAGRYFEKLLTLKPSDENFKEVVRFYTWTEQPDKTKKAYEGWYDYRTKSGISFDDEDGKQILNDLYGFFLMDQKYKSAIDVLQRQKRYKPEEIKTIDNELLILYEKSGDLNTTIALIEKVLQADSENIEALEKYMSLAKISGRGKSLEKILEKNINKNPKDTKEWERMIEYKTMAKEYDDADKWFKKWIKREPGNLELKKNLIEWYVGTEQQKRAMGYIEDLLAKSKIEDPYYLKMLSELYKWNDVKEKLLPIYLKEFYANPATFEDKDELVYILLELKKYDVAKGVLTTLTEMMPKNKEFAIDLAALYDMEGNTDAAIAVIEKCAKSTNDPAMYLDLGERYVWAGQMEKANKVFQMLIDRQYDNPSIYRYMGDIYLYQNNPLAAIKAYNEYSAKNPLDYYPHYRLGEYYISMNEKKKSEGELKTALDLMYREEIEKGATRDDDFTFATHKARIYALLGQKELSDELFGKLIKAHPDNIDIANQYIETLIDTKRLSEAHDLASDYRKRFPYDVVLINNIARIYITKQEYKKARQELEPLLERFPNDSRLQITYASILYELGDWCRAYPMFTKFKELYPGDETVKEILGELDKEFKPYITAGADGSISGSQNFSGPYARYVHPFNCQWTFEAGYTIRRDGADLPLINKRFWTLTNVVDAMIKFKPYHSITLGAGISNQMVDKKYYPAGNLFFEWKDRKFGLLQLDYSYNKILEDPVDALYYDGKMATAGLFYEKIFYERAILNASYRSNWYWVNSSKTPQNIGNDFGRDDNINASLRFIILKRPEIRLGYEFTYGKLHIKNNYLSIIPLIEETEQHDITTEIYHEWNKWISTYVGGFVGEDRKRNLTLSGLDLYGFNISNRLKLSERLEIFGDYTYSSESLTDETGRFQYFNLGVLYRFY